MGVLTEHLVRVRLRVPVGSVSVREVILIEGPAGWGEVSVVDGYPVDPLVARAAAEEAANDGFPPAVRDSVPVGALIPAVEPLLAAVLAREAAEIGVTSFKIKVGSGDDVGRVSAVRDAAGRAARIRVDANAVWDVDEAVTVLRRLDRFDLELAEQPVTTLEELARLRRCCPVPVAADEAIRSVNDARRLAKLSAADAVVLKTQALGGVRTALSVAEAAEVPAIVSSMLETSVGLAAGVALAACLPELPYACGLGTALLLDGDVVMESLVPHGGRLAPCRPVPDPHLLARYSVA